MPVRAASEALDTPGGSPPARAVPNTPWICRRAHSFTQAAAPRPPGPGPWSAHTLCPVYHMKVPSNPAELGACDTQEVLGRSGESPWAYLVSPDTLNGIP